MKSPPSKKTVAKELLQCNLIGTINSLQKKIKMNKNLPDTAYSKILSDISSLYEGTRFSVVSMYWNIGKHIVEVEQNNDPERVAGEGRYLNRELIERGLAKPV